jgi:hypothetical protein
MKVSGLAPRYKHSWEAKSTGSRHLRDDRDYDSEGNLMGEDAIEDEPQDDERSHRGNPPSQVGPPVAAGGGAGGGGGSSSSSSDETPSSRAGSGLGGRRSVASTSERRSSVASDARGVEDDEVVEIDERANRIELAKATCDPKLYAKLKELAVKDLHIWVLVSEGYCDATDLGTLLSSDGLKQLFARMTEVEPLSVKVKEAITWFYKWLRLQAEAEPDLESLDLAKFDKRAMRELITKSESSASHSKRPYGRRPGTNVGNGRGSIGSRSRITCKPHRPAYHTPDESLEKKRKEEGKEGRRG